MKKLITLTFLLFQINQLYAGTVVSPQCPFFGTTHIASPSASHEEERIKFGLCLPIDLYLEENLSSIIIDGENINLNVVFTEPPGGFGPPIEPVTPKIFNGNLLSLDQGLAEGQYIINLFIGRGDVAMPEQFLLDQSPLSVFPPLNPIDSTSNLSLFVLMLLLFCISIFILKKRVV
jgi:hypothetical protein